MIVKKILENSKIDDINFNREKVGFYSGCIGGALNLTLSITKFIIGIMINSISVIADSINNLSDSISSFITILGFKFSAVPADKDHPYGHGRVEYIATLIISMLIIMVGFQFLKTSVERFINPVELNFNWLGVSFLIASIVIKIWLWYINKTLGNKINSSILKATAMDCLFDVFTTTIVVSSVVFSKYTTFPVDGLIGVLVSFFILFLGYSLARETVSQLIGESPSDEFIKTILSEIESYKDIVGVHNYTFHRYGHLKTIATVDIELPYYYTLVKAHNLMSVLEKNIYDKYEVILITHVEPVGGNFTEKEEKIKEELELWKNKIEYIKSIHDFAIYEQNNCYFVGLQVVIDGNKISKGFNEDKFISQIDKIIKQYDEKLNNSIDILYEYI